MKLYEMEGFLRGKCIPGDLKVNETNAEYLVRKFSEAEERCAVLSANLSMINDLMKAAEQANKLAQEATENLVQERNALAAENVALKSALNDILQPDAAVLERNHRVRALDAMETPATDAFLAEVRASAIPEGYALVPQQIFLEPSDIELICSQCGDGHESGYGDFTDGLLWVGNIQRDDGSIVHGLHISSADYTEEGGVTVCEFAAQPRKGGAV
ncbi:hypothetical protein DLR14_08095 [Salmonella enterica subsp. enterica serovar Hadar]|uniref:hypothetical protein n=1 Tax=Salmonella enterica TaxID=28901 RepID=UPI000F9C663A|nr:hypothetical protein [Salmonella enterica]EAA3203245.1 hypothetical protein [Salmonella enterica subsp. enterica serovar Hadar]EBG6876280.1 hypothetical protein [Salmonella enterica subsp. enterica]EBO3013719.1 hypothetical protein [Salmonella enterica subsp. enterica serovar Newport]EBV3501086.1 hypothetical protein [Salmonella enterica subsp. enterica serovar Kottbus]EAC0572558.1 hypothetical protein [Salmonella enterica subsp. enterica serovar Hadar]